ncbi:Uncharacterised protein [Mycobacteroides abscessus subsp. abscessus]|nr:Uncharacterised protein [Mycobacteroides abscessus subsp. abscessus]
MACDSTSSRPRRGSAVRNLSPLPTAARVRTTGSLDIELLAMASMMVAEPASICSSSIASTSSSMLRKLS